MGRTGRPDAHFNPRTPCGVRPEAAQRLPTAWSISIHAPRAGCDVIGHKPGAGGVISIHAPRAGCDCSPTLETAPSSYFNPRTPCGVRPCPPTSPVGPNCISIHAPRAGCDRLPCMPPQSAAGISIHAPRAGCDPGERSHSGPHLYFNPRTPCGVRPCGLRGLTTRLLFQSTHPVRGATFETVYDFAYTEFQSTHPVRGATAYGESIRPNDIIFQSTHPVRGATFETVYDFAYTEISIHAPRAGCDVSVRESIRRDTISIHAPRAGCDTVAQTFGARPTRFQSTHPVRGATAARRLSRSNRRYFNPRTPCGVRRPRLFGRRKILLISIHAPRAGCDQIERAWSLCCAFQSTHPVRGATSDRGYAPIYARISIHAPRAGCDVGHWQKSRNRRYFNPRTPCGVRQNSLHLRFRRSQISIHAPRAGCDSCREISMQGWRYFNPRTPCGVRRSGNPDDGYTKIISIHAPRAGCDIIHNRSRATEDISIHAPRAGCDGKFDGFTRPNLRKRYKKVSVQPKKRAKKKIKEMLCSHSHIFGWISGAKVPEFPAR